MAGLRTEVIFEQVDSLIRRNEHSDALDLLHRVKKESLDSRELGMWHILHGEAMLRAGDYSLSDAEEAIKLFRFEHEHSLFARAKYLKGHVLSAVGEFVEAKESLQEAYAGYLRSDATALAARTLNRLSYVLTMQGSLASAIDNQLQCIDLFNRSNEPRLGALAALNLATYYYTYGALEETSRVFDSICAESFADNSQQLSVFYFMSALPHALRGDIKTARKTIAKAKPYLDQHIREKAIYFENLGLICVLDKDYKGAERALKAGLDISMKIAPESALVSQIKRLFADLYVCTEDWKQARRYANEALVVAEKISERIEIAACHRALARIEQHHGHNDRALACYLKALEIFAQISTRYELAVCQYRAGSSGLFPAHEATAMLYMARQYFSSEDVDQMVKAVDETLKGPKTSRATQPPDDAPTIITANKHMKELLVLALNAAPSHMNVLLTGDTGTGKDLFADYIHKASGRPGKFVRVNCAAIPDDMVEAELFGRSRGAYTGASRSRAGLIELADNGTLYLNEIAESTPSFQAKLLEVLETKEVRRLGENESRPVKFRLIAATNRKLEDEARKNGFRMDLFHRLRQIPIHLPPLSKRTEDIRPLLRYLLQESGLKSSNGDQNKAIGVIASALESREWVGNVRELKSWVERMWLQSEGDLDQMAQLAGMGIDDHRDCLLEVLGQTNGNRSEAARVLGVSETTVRRWIQKYEL